MDSISSETAIVMQPLSSHGTIIESPADGGVFENNSTFRCSRDPADHFCSAVCYDIRDEDGLTVMKGTQQLGGYCCAGEELPAIIFVDNMTLRNVVEFKLSAPTIYDGHWNVVVIDPHGNTIGRISKAGFEETNQFHIELFDTNSVFSCEESEAAESIAIYSITDQNSGLQVATIEADVAFKMEFKLIINEDANIAPLHKALFLGVVIMEDTIYQQNS
ncbi:unnamed protein product [Allacma fusca]|uniref:Phospholipid scramblase n=1 Tax=Allacma fusca TaxID=39272 RepID=A0A8J2KKE1_9HEXA|nr:unnamed protein product [Allacma fusca]